MNYMLTEKQLWEAMVEEKTEEAVAAQEKLASVHTAFDSMVKQSLEHSLERAQHEAQLAGLRRELEEVLTVLCALAPSLLVR